MLDKKMWNKIVHMKLTQSIGFVLMGRLRSQSTNNLQLYERPSRLSMRVIFSFKYTNHLKTVHFNNFLTA